MLEMVGAKGIDRGAWQHHQEGYIEDQAVDFGFLCLSEPAQQHNSRSIKESLYSCDDKERPRGVAPGRGFVFRKRGGERAGPKSAHCHAGKPKGCDRANERCDHYPWCVSV